MSLRKSARLNSGVRQSTLSFGGLSKASKPATLKAKKSTKNKAKLISLSRSQSPVKSEVAEIKHSSSDIAAEVPLITGHLLPPTAEETHARTVLRKQLEEYYKSLAASRKCLPVHQGNLSLQEKILRHFDLSSQYGPCIGISRVNRWKRAHKLGLNPPVEILAVALEMEDENGGNETRRDTRISYIDDFLSTRTEQE
ncbi:DNA polymerase delta, subunit 4-domain-containing protein [Geopyxis carbonaria]|nr:DNA polymerase delta, subunit 4-domain-containing protein [Geopyxis carbonaria]